MKNAIVLHMTFADRPETLAIALLAPFVILFACATTDLRRYARVGLVVAPLFAILAAYFAADSGPLVLDQMIYPIVLVLDPAGALLLGVTALLWTSAGVFAADDLRKANRNAGFVAFWLATLCGNIGVFMAADLASFYLFFALVSLPAYGLIDARARMNGVGGLYVAVALLGEAFLIAAFVLLASAAPGQSLLISDGVAALTTSPWRNATIALLILGFGTKIGLIPLHVWMPSTYRSTPTPAAAVLSGGAVNAGVIGFLRFLPWGHAFPEWGDALAILGMFGAFYGVAVGLSHKDAKTVLAYSSVSQMGLVVATLGMGLSAGSAGAAAGAALYAAHHGLAKGGLFLAVAILPRCAPAQKRWLAPFAALLALSLAGLPISGGVVAKLAIKDAMGDGVMGAMSTLSAIATTLLMLHFLQRVAGLKAVSDEAPGGALILSWLALVAASIAVPVACYLSMESRGLETLNIKVIWDSLWPVLTGVALAGGARYWPYRRWSIREDEWGDFVRRIVGKTASAGAIVVNGDMVLRRWPVAAAALLAIAIAISATGLL